MNVAQLHLALTHFPFVGFIASFGVLIYALWRRSSEVRNVALAGIVISGFMTLPVVATGNGSEEVVEGLPGVAHAMVAQHAYAADIASTIAVGAAVLALLTLFLLRWAPRYANGGMIASLALVVAAIVGIGWTSHLGGEIRHPELSLAWNATNDSDGGGSESGVAESGEGSEGSRGVLSKLIPMGSGERGENGEGSEGGSGERGEVRTGSKASSPAMATHKAQPAKRERGESGERGERGEGTGK